VTINLLARKKGLNLELVPQDDPLRSPDGVTEEQSPSYLRLNHTLSKPEVSEVLAI
jgi:hypothetical protein